MDLKAKLQQAKTKSAAAKAMLTPAMAEAKALLAELAAEQEAERQALADARTIKAAEALAAAEELYPEEELETLDLEAGARGAGVYVVRRPPAKVHQAWERAIAKPNADVPRLKVDLALDCVLDVDGEPRPTDAKELGEWKAQLRARWTGDQGFAMAPTSITNAGLRLAGFRMEADKS